MWKTIVTIAVLLIIGVIMFNLFRNSNSAGQSSNDIDISTEAFKEKRAENKGVVIDVRSQGEYDSGHLAIADYQYDVMSGEFEEQLDSLDKDQTYYLYCRSGNRSGKAARMMKDAGFDSVYNVGGFGQLVKAGFESE